jgi:hypothetical protein
MRSTDTNWHPSKMFPLTFSVSFGYSLRKLKRGKEVMNCGAVSFSSWHSSIIAL